MKPVFKGESFRIILVFLVSYVLFLFLWMSVKDSYGYFITVIASKGLQVVKDVKVDAIKTVGDRYVVTMSPERFRSMLVVDVSVKTSTYTFNAPLTFAIMAAFFIPLRKRLFSSGEKRPYRVLLRIYAESCLILLCVHILFVLSLEGERLTRIMMERGYEEMGVLKLGFWQFLWGFVDNMVIRFEPFLIGAYLYFRRR
jgi:hypothetical protein